MTLESEDEDGEEDGVEEDVDADESYLLMKILTVKEVMTCDVSPVAMFWISIGIGRSHISVKECCQIQKCDGTSSLILYFSLSVLQSADMKGIDYAAA